MTRRSFTVHLWRKFIHLVGTVLVAVPLAAQPHVALAQSTGSPLKIGIIGAGREGGALGTLFVKAGHLVMFSSRHPDNLKDLVGGLGSLARAGTVDEAVAFGDVMLLVVPYPGIEEIGKVHAGALAKKALVMDVSNPSAGRDGEALVKSVNDQGGAGLMTAKWLPGAHLVRAFNSINFRKLGELAHRAGEPLGVPIAGDDPRAIELAQNLIRGIGFEPVVVGGLAMGKYLVPGGPFGAEHTPAEIKQIASGLH